MDASAYADNRRIRTTAAAGSALLHVVIGIIFSLTFIGKPRSVELIELEWSGSSGAPNQSIVQSELNPKDQKESSEASGAKERSKIEVPSAKNRSEEEIPSVKREQSKKSVGTKSESKSTESSAATRRRRSNQGIAGGAGKSTGYSIEWSGTGSRRLLSGRIPRYPEGTSKELPVTLQFSVLPDGAVMGIVPLFRSDELLEREAIAALQTWRFDPLPPQFEQKPQIGKITFNFVLQKE